MKQGTILVWDCTQCPSNNIEFIRKVSKMNKSSISKVIVLANDPKTIPSSINDLSVIFQVSIRQGEKSIYDAIADIVLFSNSCGGEYSVILISNMFSIWLSLFQKIKPKNVILASSKNPQDSFEYEFVVGQFPITFLKWPSLEPLKNNASTIKETSTVYEIQEEKSESEKSQKEEFDDDMFFEEEEINNYNQSIGLEEETENDGVEDLIQPLSNSDFKYQIDLRSPLSKSPRKSPRHVPKEQAIQVDSQFKTLIESMKSIGKSMISMGEIEPLLKANMKKPIENIQSYINKAVDANLIIYDRSINYIRFRNRAFSTAPIEYV
ncbi:hypothetical protein GPJ56_010699 [Histomonas meleagridis]|uniref:uncharacterized protein n=1 Tax=Histomonas meleagridis TaxID=135588 RepID=UPI003559EA13|nr:hypothetical protein GPJ56_010699 [Histomonas meleagridis]KAH0801031.1 hypothetical protein GO595_006066 [Histomonas meleagridis]